MAARALKRIDSLYALVLTDTPLENRLEELISIVQLVAWGRLRMRPPYQHHQAQQQPQLRQRRMRLTRHSPDPRLPLLALGLRWPSCWRSVDAG